MPYTAEEIERFWAKVQRSEGCWIWTASRVGGYGSLRIRGQHLYAHRLSWELVHGPIPEGMEVCHNCPGGDNPACVNPAHLFLGTQADNMADMDRKGRRRVARGEASARARLTAGGVLEIRARFAAGEHVDSIAASFGVVRRTIHQIAARQRWGHV